MVAWWIFVQHGEVVTLEALEDVHLPQRPGAVHRPADDAGHLRGELLVVAGRRDGHVAEVEVEVEVGVGDPVRVVEPSGTSTRRRRNGSSWSSWTLELRPVERRTA